LAHIVDYPGIMLNHLETLHKPGERELAGIFLTALGFAVTDYGQLTSAGKPILFVHIEGSDPDRVNNIFYLSEVRPEQVRLEAELMGASGDRPDLHEAIATYVNKAHTKPHGIPHAGIRYCSFADLEKTVERLEAACKGPLKGRVDITVVRPDDPRALSPNLIQAFVHTDVVVCGLFCLGQLFELQGQRAAGE
jgi:hypothetical protein